MTAKRKIWHWHYEETGEPVGDTETERYSDTPNCPLCGKPADYWEGQIDQDFMGNDIEGWNYVCYGCMVGTDLIEFDRRGDR